jgi:hypothetical protein
MEDKNPDTITVEHLEGVDLKSPARQTLGTVQLLDSNNIVLIPTPSPDPKGMACFCCRGDSDTFF